MSSFNENSSAENRGASQVAPIINNNTSSHIYNNILSDNAINLIQSLRNTTPYYCSHCRSVGHHVHNCNHVTLRIFDHELYKKKEELLETDEEDKLTAFEDFIHKFHIEIVNGFCRKKYGTVFDTIDETINKIMEYFWSPEVYTADWELYNEQQDSGLGWYTDRLGTRTIDENSFVYPSSLNENFLFNRILMANVLMNEITINENDETDFLNFVNIVNNIHTNNHNNDNNNDDLPELVDSNDPLAQALVATQAQTHFPQDSERKFAINAQLILSDKLEDLEECECQICYDSKGKHRLVKLNCNHEFCAPCIIQIMNNTSQYREPCCAFCRAQMTDFTVGSEEDLQNLQERILT
uniref:RING-type domain-containing protein n=1 Tax=viral metagenome TaxID=1070528 RepID=A0A6C0IJN9_9ZZZZ